MTTEPLKSIEIHRSLVRPILLGGAERELCIINITLVFALVFGVGFTKLTVISALFLLTVGQYALIELAKKDPLMSHVYKRHIRYQDYYPARGSRLARRPIIQPSIKIGK